MRIASLVLVFTVFGGVLGCGGPQFATVEGEVTLDGKPLADVEVQFIPEPGQAFESPPASGYTDASGKYAIKSTSTYGVVVGYHRVCINDATIMSGRGPQVDLESGEAVAGMGKRSRPSLPRVPAIYSDANQTPFKSVEVKEGTQDMDFSLQRNK